MVRQTKLTETKTILRGEQQLYKCFMYKQLNWMNLWRWFLGTLASNFRNRVRPVSGYVNHKKVGTLAGRYTYFCVGKNSAIQIYIAEKD